MSAPRGVRLEARLNRDEELAQVIEQFPEMSDRLVHVTSPKTRSYNCTAWAVHLTKTNIRPPIWGWDGAISGEYWPESVPPRGTVRAYEEVFETFGYRPCVDGTFEIGTEKIALYAQDPLECLHAARQTVNGMWTSKMGECADIEHHSPAHVAGSKFGQVVAFMARQYGLPRRLDSPSPTLVMPTQRLLGRHKGTLITS